MKSSYLKISNFLYILDIILLDFKFKTYNYKWSKNIYRFIIIRNHFLLLMILLNNLKKIIGGTHFIQPHEMTNYKYNINQLLITLKDAYLCSFPFFQFFFFIIMFLKDVKVKTFNYSMIAKSIESNWIITPPPLLPYEKAEKIINWFIWT